MNDSGNQAVGGAEPTDLADAEALELGALSDQLGYHLAHASVSTAVLFDRHIGEPLQISKVEYSLLMLLLNNKPPSPKRLASALALTAPKMTMLLDRMQERGLLLRQRSEVDRRSQNVLLTDEGRRIAEAAAAAARPAEQALYRRLSRAEHAMLIELLQKVAAG